MNTNILVTGATGKVGAELVAILKNTGANFKVASRHPEKAKQALGNVTVVDFDFDNPTTVKAGLVGIDGLFMVGPSLFPNAHQEIIAVLQAAKEAGVKHVVFLSALGANLNPESPQSKIEAFIKENGFTYTILRPTFFMQNFIAFWGEGVKYGQFSLPAADGKTGFIDTRDIAALAALALTTNNHQNKEYNLTGSEALTHTEVAEILSNGLGRPVAYNNVSADDFATLLKSWGMSDFATGMMNYLYETVRNGWVANLTPDLETALGRAPITFAQFVASHKEAWAIANASN